MNGIDVSNQLRIAYSVQRYRNNNRWSLIFLYFLIDQALTNAFLIWRRAQDPSKGQLHKKFLKSFVDSLFTTKPIASHTPTALITAKACTWKGCQPRAYWGDRRPRIPLSEIKNSVRVGKRGSDTKDYCNECDRALCIKKGCWKAFHD